MGHRVLPHRSLEPLQTTHSPLADDRAVMVGSSSFATPVSFKMLCSQVSGGALLVCVCEKVNISRLESQLGGVLMFFGLFLFIFHRVFYIVKVLQSSVIKDGQGR
jgi:hypothetical protein